MKNIFYKKRLKVPVWMQIYVAWWIILLLAIPVIFYWGTIKKSDFESRRNVIQNPGFSTQTTARIIQSAKKSLYPNGLFSPKIFIASKDTYGLSKWIMESRSVKSGGLECLYSTAYLPGKSSRNLVIGIPIENHGEIAVGSIITMNSLANLTNQVGIYFVFYEDRYRCYESNGIVKNSPGLPSQAQFLFLHTHEKEIKSVAINGNMRNVSSLNWQFILPEINHYPKILHQIGITLSPFFQGPEGMALTAEKPAISLIYPELMSPSEIATDLRRMVQYFENNMDSGIANNSFWITKNRAFTQNGFRILIGLLLILIWFPLLNHLYRSPARLEVLRGIFAVLYYMLVPLFFFTGVNFSYDMGNVSKFIIPGLILVSIALLFFFKRLETNLFNLKTNGITAIFVTNLVFSITAIFQPILFILLVPLSFSLNKNIQNKGRGRFVWVILGLIPFAFIIFDSVPDKYADILLSASFYLSTFFNDFWRTTNTLMLVGAVVAALRQR